MITCTSSASVIEAVRSSGARRIGIDGIDGSGKTHLARDLAKDLGTPLVCLDDFLEKDRNSYVEFIDYKRLSDYLTSAEHCVIEGVCLLQVLGHVDARVDLHIYIKRYGRGIWIDEYELNIQEPIDVFLERERQAASMFSTEPITSLGLAEEVIRYHVEFRPHRSAHITYIAEERSIV